VTEVELHLVKALEALTEHYEATEHRMMGLLNDFSERLHRLEQLWSDSLKREERLSREFEKRFNPGNQTFEPGMNQLEEFGRQLFKLSMQLNDLQKRLKPSSGK
jgi:chromosome segregation ATPase